jgi:polyhydroxyalkanoate synthesis regulator phasin
MKSLQTLTLDRLRRTSRMTLLSFGALSLVCSVALAQEEVVPGTAEKVAPNNEVITESVQTITETVRGVTQGQSQPADALGALSNQVNKIAAEVKKSDDPAGTLSAAVAQVLPPAEAKAETKPESIPQTTPEPGGALVESEMTETTPVVVEEAEQSAPVSVAVEPNPVPEPEVGVDSLPNLAGPAEERVATTGGDVQVSSIEAPTPTTNVTVNLINLLVKKGVLTKEEAQGMVAQAQAEAEIARAQTQAEMVEIAQIVATDVTTEQLNFEDTMPQPNEGDVRVTYVPEVVKQELREQIKFDVVEEVKGANLGLGAVVPEWVNRIKPLGDLRFRYQANYFPEGNDATGAFPNFNAINTGVPFDVTGNVFSPQINVDQNRNYFLTRARFGAMVDLGDNFVAGLRIATGTNNSPVSTNQGSGTPGYFTKYALWLDRAFMAYELGILDEHTLRFQVGRMDNPFFSTPLIYDDDLGFDGIALNAKFSATRWLKPFLNAGAFPVYNTDLNFATNNPEKFASYDKYLFGIQGGTEVKLGQEFGLKTSLAYYYFYNIEGKLSTPYVPLTSSDAGDTDNSRPSFAQKGNTYMALRDIIPDVSNDFGTKNQWQYFGLATPFQNLAFTGQLTWNRFEPVQVSLVGEFIKNMAWNFDDINAKAVNNRGPIPDDDFSDVLGSYVGTDTAWLVELRVGAAKLQKRWDWSLGFGYRYIGADAVVDGFNDSDFGLGGTNMKGFTAGGLLALSPNVWVGIRWMGATSVAGPTYKSDVLQIDINGKF